jgi:hypothetical protein
MLVAATGSSGLGGIIGPLGVLLASLGLSSTAGLRAYLPLLAVGVASDANLVPLQSNFKGLGSPVLLVILGVLAVGEFAVDKVPIVDHLSDLIHTVIRPASGALIMAGTSNSLSDANMGLAALVGAGLAFAFHGVKATVRPAVSATTAGIGNPVVSVVEDIVVIFLVVLLVTLPIVGVAVLMLLTTLLLRTVRRLVRRLRGRGAKRNAAPVSVASSYPADAPTLPGNL